MVEGKRCEEKQATAFPAAAVQPQRDVMDLHKALGHPNEKSTRATAKRSDIVLTGEWAPCEECSKAKAHAQAVPKETSNKATGRLERVFIDLTGPMKEMSVGQRRFGMVLVDDYSSMTWIRILKHKSDAPAALKNFISEVATPANLKIRNIRTDEGGEFVRKFQELLDDLGINHEMTPPGTPQHNGKAERRLGVIKEKTIALLEGMTEGKSGKLWAEAMSFSADMYNRCVPAGKKTKISPFEQWHGFPPKTNDIKAFGTVGFMRALKQSHKLEPRGKRFIMLGLAHNHPSGTVRVLNRATGEVVARQGVKWHTSSKEVELKAIAAERGEISNKKTDEDGGPLPTDNGAIIQIIQNHNLKEAEPEQP